MDSVTCADANGHVYSNTRADCHIYPNTYRYTHTRSYSDRHAGTHADAYPYSYSYSDPGSDLYTNPDTQSNTHLPIFNGEAGTTRRGQDYCRDWRWNGFHIPG